jgi:hypothetical protein
VSAAAATIAARGAARSRVLRRVALAALVLGAGLIALPLLVLLALGVALDEQSGQRPAGEGPPAVYLPLYAAAARAYRVSAFALAALHASESSYGADPAAWRPNAAGAIGPMQFLPATFARYRDAYRAATRPAAYPHRCAPHGCITDDFDAIMAAAAFLHDHGAGPHLDARTLQAFAAYKGTPPASLPAARAAYQLAEQLQAAAAGGQDGLSLTGPAGPVLERIAALADQLAAAKIPYCYGAGHVTPATPTVGVYCHDAANHHIAGSTYHGLDCSSAVSLLLQHAGLDLPTLTSSQFMHYGQPGPGRHLTIWANPDHVFLTLDGRAWGTSNSVPYGGPTWAPHTTIGFTPVHPEGL